MKNCILFTMALFFSLTCSSQDMAVDKAIELLTNNKGEFQNVATQIWEFAELGYLEEKSSALLQSKLQAQGFKIEKGVAGMPTAFVASYGSGKPVIAILGEYDALPGVSQTTDPERTKRPETNNGHACGHHLFGTGSMAASIAVKQWLEQTKTSGTIRFYGTPAEEGGAGKVYMVRAGLFDDVDAVLHWHPSSGNSADARSSLSNKSAKFRFYGNASHASASPHKGRSALDAVEAMNHMANLMREHIPADSRLHYVITSGGEAPNVVPEYAEVFYYCRHPQMANVKANFEWLVKIAEAAAMGTETRMEYEVIHGLYNVLPNEALSSIMHKNLSSLGGVDYTAEEVAFAKKIQATLNTNASIKSAGMVKKFEVFEKGSGGSTDVGDVSWVVPTAGLSTATWVPGTSAHTWQAVAAGGMSIGFKGMMLASKTLALTAIDIFKDPKVISQATRELGTRRGAGFEYQPLLGDREPPLDYRH